MQSWPQYTTIINEELVSEKTPFLMYLASKVGFLH